MTARDVGLIAVDDLKAARVAAGGRRLIEVLEERLGLPAAVFVAHLGATADLPVIGAAELLDSEPSFEGLNFGEALRNECVVLRRPGEAPLLVVADPFDGALRDRVGRFFLEPVRLAIAHRADILACLHRYEEGSRAFDSMAGATTGAARDANVEELSLKSISDDTSTVVRLVNSTLHDALKAGASDIHLESSGDGMTIRHRVDGVLTSVGSMSGGELAEQTISRIKVMAELDIAERRVPQDGRIRVGYQGREIDLRVSVMPSIHGEDAVLRILDRRAVSDELSALTLDSLGFDAPTMEVLRELASEPYGMLLVTGP
ncbi:MAG: Flp pilus assembly complex ATPase component TadA, partial [Rhodocyclales bacterium]|nr:Flp pilus assembly complex ATPase component TadA [Rhodocyclales bacterium]